MENSFGCFLKQKRQEKNLTQKDLAKLLFVSESAVSKWEKDVAHPDITLLPKLAEILKVTEHELITASIDNKSREEKVQARKWRAFSMTWSMFFYIAYAVALIPCFICDLAINKGLTWFWIVLSALILAFTFTNLPKLIKKHKLLLIPLSMFMAFCLLIAVCAIYTKGAWFWIVALSVFFGLIMIFMPIYIAKYDIFAKVRKFNDFLSVFIDFVVLNILLIVINAYTVAQNADVWWFFKIALPIVAVVYVMLNLFLSVRFLKINKLLKTSVILFMVDIFAYIVPLFFKFKNPEVQHEIDRFNVFKANFSNWNHELSIGRNVNLIICLVILTIAVIFLAFGLISYFKKKNKKA